MSSSRYCLHYADLFCCFCGFYLGPRQVQHGIEVSTKFTQMYQFYFGMKNEDQDKSRAPHIVCGTYRSKVEGWVRCDCPSMPFAISRIWNHRRLLLYGGYFNSAVLTHGWYPRLRACLGPSTSPLPLGGH